MKNKKIIALLTAAVLVGSVLFGSCGQNSEGTSNSAPSTPSVSSKTADSEQGMCVSYNGSDYFVGGFMAKLDGGSDATVVTLEDNDRARVFATATQAFDGSAFYGRFSDEYQTLYKITMTSDVTAKKEEWVSAAGIASAIGAEESENGLVYAVHDFASVGDNIYAVFYPSNQHLNSLIKHGVHILKLSKADGSVEEIDGLRAACMTAAKSKLFYYDNGIMPDGEGYTVDHDREGIYSANPDGSEKVKLCEVKSSNDEGRVLVTDLKAVGDRVLFVDNSDEGQDRICSIKTDGSDKKYITDEPARYFAVDTDKKELYYSGGEMTDLKLKKCSLNGGEASTVAERIGYDVMFSYKNRCLYFTNPSGNSVNSLQDASEIGENNHLQHSSGMILKLDSNKFDVLHYYMITKFVEENGIKKIENGGDGWIWEKDVENSSDFSIM